MATELGGSEEMNGAARSARWIGLCDAGKRRFSRSELPTTLARGTIVFETAVTSQPRLSQVFGLPDMSGRSLAFSAIPGGGIAFVHRTGDELVHGAIPWSGERRLDTIRISYAWDCRQGLARLALEAPEDTSVRSVVLSGPPAPRLSDLRHLIMGPERIIADDVVFAAISARVEPLGPMPTLHPSCPVATPHGDVPVHKLKRGDLVLTETGEAVPVLERVDRQLPARGSFAPIRLRAPYFGLRHDIVVAPEQRLLLRGSEVEYLFGHEAVLVPARYLVSGVAARAEPSGPLQTFSQLLLPQSHVLQVAGAEVESLYIGRLRRKPEVLRNSLLARLPRHTLPDHARLRCPVLRPFEAITLIEQRAA